MSFAFSQQPRSMSVREFYDELAPRYHLIYADWEASISRQGAVLAGLLDEQ